MQIRAATTEPDRILRDESLKGRAVVSSAIEVQSIAVILTAGELIEVSVGTSTHRNIAEGVVRIAGGDCARGMLKSTVLPRASDRKLRVPLESVRVKYSSMFSPVRRFALGAPP